jgi:hypothetical protein
VDFAITMAEYKTAPYPPDTAGEFIFFFLESFDNTSERSDREHY